MLIALNGKTMTYDGENRPVSVSHQDDTTSYTYRPDGQRLKKSVTSSGTTLFAGAVEVRSYNAASPSSGTVVVFFCESIRVAGGGQFLYTTDFQLDGIFPLHIPTLADYMPHLSGRLHLCSRPDDSSETVGGFDPEVIIPA